MMTVIPLIVLCFSLIFLAGYTFFTIRYREGSEQEQMGGKPLPMVSILKPLRHIDEEIEKNFESFFTLDYPRFEILFGVDSMDDPLVGLISSLRARYPHVPVKVIRTGHSATENPKIHKLAMMAAEAAGSLYWKRKREEKGTGAIKCHPFHTFHLPV